jgi:hypothetical protein
MPEANDLIVGIMVLVAKAEREAISRRTKEALAVEGAQGEAGEPEWGRVHQEGRKRGCGAAGGCEKQRGRLFR